jgi:hypothetical protein
LTIKVTLANLDFDILLKTLKSEDGKHIYQFLIDEKVSKELYDDYTKTMKGRKKKPKKKAKAKGGKKK